MKGLAFHSYSLTRSLPAMNQAVEGLSISMADIRANRKVTRLNLLCFLHHKQEIVRMLGFRLMARTQTGAPWPPGSKKKGVLRDVVIWRQPGATCGNS
jgi:hypothetical protein